MSAERRPAFATWFWATIRPPANRLCENASPRLYWFLAPKPRLPNDENGLLPSAQRLASSSPARRLAVVVVAFLRYWSQGVGGGAGLVVSMVGLLPLRLENCDASIQV